MRQTPLGTGRKSWDRGSTFSAVPKPLARRTPLKAVNGGGAGNSTLKPGRGFAASEAQRLKVRFAPCIVCGAENVHPAHLIDRSLGGDDDPRAVVPLCPAHHDQYDNARTLSLLEHLEPHYRPELAYAVQLVGVVTALERITNEPWAPARRCNP